MYWLTSTRKLLATNTVWVRGSLLVVAATVAGSCEKKPVEPTSTEISIIPETVVIFIGASQQLTALGAVGGVTWSSSNTQVATVVAQTGLVQGVGRGEATITATALGGSSTRVVSVIAQPTLRLSTSTIAFSRLVGGADPAAQTVNVTNTGDGSISNLVVGPISYGPGQTTGWLTATLGSATAPTVLTLRVTGATLAPATYNATIPVSAAGAASSPQSIAVTLTVGQAPTLILNPLTLPPFTTWGNSTALPPSQSLQVTNSGIGTISGLTVQTAYGSGSNWLNALFQGGNTTTPTTLLLQPNSTTLPHGSYTATVTVGSTQPGITPRQASITYHVQTFTVEIAPRLTASCSGCHAHFAGTASQIYAAASARVVAGNPNASLLVCKPFNVSPSCNLTHGGGKFTDATLLAMLTAWITFGAPFQ